MLFYLSRMTELDECFFPSGNDELDFELEGKDTMYGSNSILFQLLAKTSEDDTGNSSPEDTDINENLMM